MSACLEQAAGSQSVLSLAAHHEIGALMPGVAFQDQGDEADTVYTRLNGSYDPGVAKVMGVMLQRAAFGPNHPGTHNRRR